MGLLGKIGEFGQKIGQYAIPTAEIVGSYFTGNPALAAQGISDFNKADKPFESQLKDKASNPAEAGNYFGMGYTQPYGGTSSSPVPDSGGVSADGSGDNLGSLMAGGTAIIGGLAQMFNKHKEDKALQSQRRETKAENADTSNRREATYRQNREMLKAFIQNYADKHGVKLPTDSLPGAGTARQLPFENPLYTGQPQEFYGGVQTANPQPKNATTTGSMSPVSPLPISPPTDGSTNYAPKTEQQVTDETKGGKPKDTLPTENDQQTAAKRLNIMFGYDPEDAQKAYNWKKM